MTAWESGEDFANFQRKLVRAGYALPKHGADGSPGNETRTAIEDFAFDHGLSFAGDGFDEENPSDMETLLQISMMIEDLANQKNWVTIKKVQRIDLVKEYGAIEAKGARPWGSVDTIVLHQTGYEMDRGRSSSPRNWSRLRAHLGVPRRPSKEAACFYQVIPFNQIAHHANSLNGRSVGVEVSGNFSGLRENEKTLWRPSAFDPKVHGPHDPTPEQILATRGAIEFAVREVALHGGEIKYIMAHRQSSKHRIGDPGEVIWEECGLWAQKELGLVNDPRQTFGSGRPLPDEWTNAPNGIPYFS